MAGEILARPSSSLDMALSASRTVTALQDQPEPRRPLLLKNKLPRWNAGAAQQPSHMMPLLIRCASNQSPGARCSQMHHRSDAHRRRLAHVFCTPLWRVLPEETGPWGGTVVVRCWSVT